VASEDRSAIQPPPAHNPALVTRIERLERALDESKSQVAALKADVATLVRALADNRKQSSRPTLVPSNVSRWRIMPGIAPKIAGLVLGAALGLGGWMYLSSDTDASIAVPATVAAAESDTQGLAPNVASAAESDDRGLAPNVTPPKSDTRGLAPNVALPESDTRGLAPNVASPESDVRGQPPNVAARRGRDVRGQPPNVAATAKYVGTLSIDANPDGEVFVNRKSAGRTPLRLTDLRAGSHLIWIERQGYRRWTRVVRVPADRVTLLSAELEPLAAR
jgi:hypothetical protein